MFVPYIRCFDGIGSSPHLENQIHDFFQRRIGHMRHVPAAEAHVISNAVLRDSRERVVQRLNAQIGPLAIFLRTLLNQVIVHVGQHCIVYLEQQTGIVNGAVLFAQRVGDGVDVIVLVRIIFVDAVVGRAGRRNGRKEGFFNRHLLQSRCEIRQSAIDGYVIQIADPADARLGIGPSRQPRKVLKDGFGKPLPVAAEPNYRTQLVGADFESADSFQNVVRPALLSIFAVANDIDSHFRLPADHFQGLPAKYAVVLRQVLWLFPGRGQVTEFFGPYQTSYVGSQYTMFAALHELDGFHSKDTVHSSRTSIENSDRYYHYS